MSLQQAILSEHSLIDSDTGMTWFVSTAPTTEPADNVSTIQPQGKVLNGNIIVCIKSHHTTTTSMFETTKKVIFQYTVLV